MKKRGFMLLVCFLLLAALAGCAENDVQTGRTEPEGPKVAYYFDGIISLDGQVLFTQEGSKEYVILSDQNERQRYILEVEKTYDSERLTEYGEAVQTACAYRVYDLQGALQKDFSVQLEGGGSDVVNYNFPQDGDLDKFCIIVNQVDYDGRVIIFDLDGNVLVDEQVLAENEPDEWQEHYVWLDTADDFIQVRCSFYKYSPAYAWQESAYFYDLNGQPLELDRDYMYIYKIYDDFSEISSNYYGGYYENVQGQTQIDILDKDCQVLVSGLNGVNCWGDGRFVVEQGFKRGLIDAQGNWIYQETIFSDLED